MCLRKTTNIPLFPIISGLASIIGLIGVFRSNEENITYALILWIITLLLSLLYLFFEIYKIIYKKQQEKDYNVDSVFIIFESVGLTQSKYQIFKIIQSKQQDLTNIIQHFNWSGTFEPKLSSYIEDIKKEDYHFEKGKNNNVQICFKRPLMFNESATVHFCAEVDDTDNAASPHVQFTVDKPIRYLSFRIILRNKPNDYTKVANLLKKPIKSSYPVEFKRVDFIIFDAKAKTYFHQIINPEVGYYYRIEWEKDNIATT